MTKKHNYSIEPKDKQTFTNAFDRFYTKVASSYDIAVKLFPFWKAWLKKAIPYIQGPRVLEVSFGTGYLLTQYADRFDTYGIDYNARMVLVAKRNLSRKGISASLQQGNVESLPYESEFFDSIVNTMAISAYPDGAKALSEMRRVLKTGGKLILIDINYPKNGNWIGACLTRLWARLGDIIRDMDKLFRNFNFTYTDKEIGGLGSVHLYVAEKT